MSEPLAAALPAAMSDAAPAPTPAAIPVVTVTQATQISPATPAQEKMSETRQVESERMTYGQRRVNLIWEVTQAAIAVSLTMVQLGVASGFLPGASDGGDGQLANAFFLVIGFYFGRTNHQKIGGVGGETSRDAGR